MKKQDWVLTVLFVLAWGTNFTVTKIGIGSMPPMLLAALRFLIVAFPACLFVRPPKIAFRHLLGYGLTIGVGQFSCLYYAIYIGMPAGLTSVVIQSSSFITILIAAQVFHERLKRHQIIGLIVAVAGLVLIGLTAHSAGGAAIPLAGLLLTVMAAFFWSLSSIIIKKAAMAAESTGTPLNMFGVVAWSAWIPPLPMLLLSFTMDSPQAVWRAFLGLGLASALAILYLSWCSTLFGAGVWNYLLAKYETGRVAPLSLLVPVVGLLVARVALNERLSALQWAGSAVIIVGLLIFNLGFGPVHRLFAAGRPTDT